MTKTGEKIGHTQLVGGGETTLHSHTGGGSINIKSGQSTGAKAATVQVDFSSAFASIPRVVMTPHSVHTVSLVEVTTAYFKWTNNSKNVDVTIDWIATDAGG